DLGRLRAGAMQIALGVVAARRTTPGMARQTHTPTDPPPARPRPSRAGTALSQPGVAVPLFPPPPRAPRTLPPPAPAQPSTVVEPPRRAATTPPPPSSGAAVRAATEAAARFALDKQLFPVLCSIGHNLTLAAAEGRLDDVVGREAEIEEVLDILAKRHA